MAHQQNHPYHLVDPSPMPLLMSFSIMAMLVGVAMSFHQHDLGFYVLGAGLIAVLTCCFYWWRDVIAEGINDKAHTGAVQMGMRVGMALFIVSEVMFFFAFFWAFFGAALFPILPLQDIWAIGDGPWPPDGTQTFDPFDLPLMNTLVLLLSGTTVTWAHHALLERKNDEVITSPRNSHPNKAAISGVENPANDINVAVNRRNSHPYMLYAKTLEMTIRTKVQVINGITSVTGTGSQGSTKRE